MYIRHLCQPVVVFPVMPKLKPYCSCKKNSFCVTCAQRLITIPAHSFPRCPIPTGCPLHLLGCFGCVFSRVATPGPLHFCRCCSLERCEIQSCTNGISFVSRNIACRVTGVVWENKIYICVFEGKLDVSFWPDMSFCRSMSWIYYFSISQM